MDISESILPQKAFPSGHAKIQINCVKEHQVTGVPSLSFHRKFWALDISHSIDIRTWTTVSQALNMKCVKERNVIFLFDIEKSSHEANM